MKYFNFFVLTLVLGLLFACAESSTDDNGGDSDAPKFVYNPGQGDSDSESGGDLYYEDGDIDRSDTDLTDSSDGDLTEDADKEEQTTDGDSDFAEEDWSEYSEQQEQEQTEEDGDSSQEFHTCESFNDCPDDLVCDISLGRCERRKSLESFEMDLYSFHPPQAAPGDMLIIDGNGYSMFNTTVNIGSNSLGLITGNLSVDENRILVPVKEGYSGNVSISNNNGFNSNTLSVPLEVMPTGVIACDGSTPEASYENGTNINDVGPYAAGYVDIIEDRLRVFYPAECGSIRRPPVQGEFPVVMILHGNGAVYINYEYIGQLLATWGFISVIPESESENDSEASEAVHIYIYERISPFIGADLGDIHPVLDGLTTTSEIAMIGHSRGCARMQNVYERYPDIKDNAVASAWLGPAQDYGLLVPGYFMVFGAEHDKQSSIWNYNDAWDDHEQQSRCKIWVKGGNHGLFGDHKIYSGFFEGTPTITRRQELETVTSFVLPLMQRAFGLEEHWPEQLDSPSGTNIYDVTCELD